MRNWGLIRSGATFQALVSSLVFFEDPQAALFGRPGRDGAQDVRSGDGTRVYQAKFHQDQSASKAIADAKREAAKIATYRQADSEVYGLWQDVTHWRLVTNAEFNPADRQRWDNEIVPIYARLGLVADYWERAYLDALLDKHRDLDRAYFRNETRAFLSLHEVRERLLDEEALLRRTQDIGFFGRDSEVQLIRQFLSGPELFKVIHGPGGIGKTRLLLETGRRITEEGRWQVLWANVATMGASAAWFDGIVPERETLLIVDEPRDDSLLRLLTEQIGGRVGRATRWRIVVAVRSPKDPVLRFLRSPKVAARVSEQPLSVLSEDAATAMCADLLGTGPLGVHSEEWRGRAAREVARRFNQHPVWVTLAVKVLETEGDLSALPSNAAALADLYLEEVISPEGGQSNTQVLALLRWVSLLGVVNRQDDAVMQVVADEAGFSGATGVQAALAALVRRRALVERGAENRLVELRPDVVRDHVLLRWLTVDVGFGSTPIKPSSEAIALAKRVTGRLLSGTFTPTDAAMLVSLARTERLLALSGTPIDLLDPVFGAVKGSLPTITAGVGSVLVEALVPIAAHRPADTIDMIRDLRRAELSTSVESGIFGSHTTSRHDVIAELGWLAFHAATGAVTQIDRELVMDELCALARLEAEISAQSPAVNRNDGKRAAALLARVICGGPEFLDAFDDAARTIGLRLLQTFATNPPDPTDRTLAKALLGAAISLERTQSWSENYTFHFRTVVLRTGSAAWATRETLVGRMRELVESSSAPVETRVLMWELLAEAHVSGIRCSTSASQAAATQARALLLEDLRWTLSIFRKRIVGFDELAAAREIWQWHLRFDDAQESREVSETLETFYTANEIAAEMEPLLGDDDWERKSVASSQKADALAQRGVGELVEFLNRASRYLGGDHELYKLFDLAHELGRHATTSANVRSLIEQLLGLPSVTPRTDFAAIAAGAWVRVARAEGRPDEILESIEQMLEWCGSDAQRVNLISRIYGRSTRVLGVSLPDAERKLVLSLAPKFVAEGQPASCVHVIAKVCNRDWLDFTAAVDQVVAAVPGTQISAVVVALVEAVDAMTRDWRPDDPEAATTWLMEHVLRLPDLDPPGSSLIWHLEELLKRLGRLRLAWLPSAIEKRLQMERQSSGGRVFAVGYKTHIGRYVQPVKETEAADPEVRSSVERLVALAFETGSIAHHLPRILRDVDPDGRLVPTVIASRVTTVSPSEMWSLARLARAYKVNTPGWREIARPILLAAARSADDERRSLYHALTSKDSQAWTSAVGEVPQVFRDAVQEARARLEGETDPSFVQLWQWTVASAEARLRAEEEQAKEQRGE